MRDDVRREFEKRIRDLPNKRIEAEMEEWAYDSEERSILRGELEERRRSKDALKEPRHKKLKLLHWFAAVVSLIAVAAVCLQWHRSPSPAAPTNPLTAISPVPTPQESPAVTSVAPTLEDAAPPETAESAPEETEPAPEDAAPQPEEAEPPEEAELPLEEAEPAEEAELPLEEAEPAPERP